MTTSDSRDRGIVLALAVSAGMYGMLISLLAPAIPALAQALDVDQASATWLFTAFLLGSAVATPVLGRLGDVVGKKRMILLVLAITAAGLLLSALAPNLTVMCVGRVVQGALGGILPLAFGLIRDELPSARTATSIGVTSGFVGVGTGVGYIVAGPLIDLSFRWIFWVPLVLVVLCWAAVVAVVPAVPGHSSDTINWLGAATMSGWLVTLLLGITQGPRWGWESPAVLALLAATPVLVLAWVRSEVRALHPLVDMTMMRLPAVWTTNLVSLLMGVGLIAVAVIAPGIASADPATGYGFGSSTTGVSRMMLPIPVGTMVFSMLSGVLTRRLGSKTLLTISCGFVGACYVCLAAWHGELWNLYVATALLGIGSGFGFSAMANLIVAAVPPSQTGVAAGMNGNIRLIGQVIGTGVAVTIIASTVAADDVPLERGYTVAAVVTAALLALALVISFLIPSRDADRPAAGGAAGLPDEAPVP